MKCSLNGRWGCTHNVLAALILSFSEVTWHLHCIGLGFLESECSAVCESMQLESVSLNSKVFKFIYNFRMCSRLNECERQVNDPGDALLFYLTTCFCYAHHTYTRYSYSAASAKQQHPPSELNESEMAYCEWERSGRRAKREKIMKIFKTHICYFNQTSTSC